MLPGETTGGKAITRCVECDRVLPLSVCQSNAGYYIGYNCDNCGPCGRETDYFEESEKAEKALNKWLRLEGPLERMRT